MAASKASSEISAVLQGTQHGLLIARGIPAVVHAVDPALSEDAREQARAEVVQVLQNVEKSLPNVRDIILLDKNGNIVAVGIQTAAHLTEKSGISLNEILHLSDSTADQVRSIATASEQQSATSEEINRTILEVNTFASDTATSMRKAYTSVEQLTKQTQILQNLIITLKQ